jgi:hypothetical protein
MGGGGYEVCSLLRILGKTTTIPTDIESPRKKKILHLKTPNLMIVKMRRKLWSSQLPLMV